MGISKRLENAAEGCFYCEKDVRLLALMLPLAELPWADLYLFRDQKHPGRCVCALKGHCDELWQLTPTQREGFFADLSLAAEAIARYARADKLNYAVYGDKVSHFHVHLVPKRAGELQWGGPFTDDLPKVLLPETELVAQGRKLLAVLDAVAAERGAGAPLHKI